jgi:hypothetical protein
VTHTLVRHFGSIKAATAQWRILSLSGFKGAVIFQKIRDAGRPE